MRSTKPKKTVLVIVGMPGAGKSLASSVMKAHRIPVFVSGDIIRAEARKRKLKFTRKNLGELMLKIRKEEGMGAVAKRLVPLVEKESGEFVVYEGARSVEEVDELRRKYGVVVIAINASPQARFRNVIIVSLGLGLRSLLRWRIGRLRMKTVRLISRGELDEYSK